MRKPLLYFAAIVFFCFNAGFMPNALMAQAPQVIPYQAVARDVNGNLLNNATVCVLFTVHDASTTGTVIYQETQVLPTNNLGMFVANVGQGNIITGTISGISWAVNNKYLQVQLDATGNCSGYADMGTTQMQSVPYALYAVTAGNAASGGTTQVNADWNASSGLAEILNKPTIPVFPPAGGTALQYINGAGSLVTFPTNVSAFTNDAGYLTTATANSDYIQNGTSAQSGASFNIAGSGAIGTTLNVGTNAAIGGANTVTGATTLNGGLTETGTVTATGNVVINDASPSPLAALDVASGTQGFLPPRMTTAQRNAITNGLTTTQMQAVQGLTIYNTTTNCIETFVGTSTPDSVNWQPMGCGCTAAPTEPCTISGSTSVCAPASGVAYSVYSFPLLNYTYNWTVPTGATISGSGSSITVNCASGASSGNIKVTATNNCGTSLPSTLAVTVNTTSVAPTGLSATNTTICNGGSTTLTQTGGSLGTSATWNWYSDAAYTQLVGTGTGSTASLLVSPSTTTTYYLEASGTASPCATNAQGPSSGITITVNTVPTITGTTGGSVCGTGTVNLSATASAGTINWWTGPTGGSSQGTGTSFTTPSISATTVYYVDATANGCTTGSRTPVTATYNALPSVAAIGGGQASVCTGSTTAAFTDGTSGGSWSITGSTGSTINSSGVVTGGGTAGTAGIVYTYSNGTCSNTASASITVNTLPSVAAIGGGQASVCTGATTAAFTDGTSGGTWSITGSTGSTINSSGVVTGGGTAGTPNVVYTITSGGCSNTATKSITVNTLPSVAALGGGAASVCPTSTTAAFTDATSGGTWSITGSTGSTISSGGVVTGGSTAGTAGVVYTVTSNGCSNTANANITVNQAPTVTAANAITGICAGSTTAALAGAAYGGSATSAVWSASSGTFANNGGTNPASATYTAASSDGTGSITLTLTTSGGSCGTVQSTNTVSVTALQTGTHTFSCTGAVQNYTVASGACAPTTITIDMAGAQGGAGVALNNPTCPTPGYTTSDTFPNPGGYGGRVQFSSIALSTLGLSQGQSLYIYVGCQGAAQKAPTTACGQWTSVAGGGYNGGGNGSPCENYYGGGGAGGGGSDISSTQNATPSARTRIIVAGGGGGGGGVYSHTASPSQAGGTGGSGSTTAGGNGNPSAVSYGGGYGGSTSGGASNPTCTTVAGQTGTAGQGGAWPVTGACYTADDAGGGGGGGGYYGGGASADAGGGGGSDYVPAAAASSATLTGGYQAGNGYIKISYP